jgi:biofilm PGA synthesis N-glycosyltransferase PgaC
MRQLRSIGTAKVKSYALVTPAHNEIQYLERTIQSICFQTVLPTSWVIVSDGSTDGTDDLIKNYSNKYQFIHYLRMAEHDEKSFSCKVFAFNAGYEALQGVDYDLIGNIDADVSFEPTYFEKMIEQFTLERRLGLAGGIIHELIGSAFIPQNISRNSVAGAVQLFRRQCFEEIKGYIPLRLGGIDTAAEIKVRASGWLVRSYPEFPVHHYRRVVTGKKSIYMTNFNRGISNYILGYHPLFQVFSCFLRIFDRPYFLGALYLGSGYIWAKVKGMKKMLPDKVISYLRTEQMQRLGLSLKLGKWK